MSGLMKIMGWRDKPTSWFGWAAKAAQPVQPVDVESATYRLWTSDGTDSGNSWPANRVYFTAETTAHADALVSTLGAALSQDPRTRGTKLRKMGSGDGGIEVHVFGLVPFREDQMPADVSAFIDVGIKANVITRNSVYANLRAGRLLDVIEEMSVRRHGEHVPPGTAPERR